MNRALQGFSHRGATHDLLWNVSGAHRLAAKLDAIVDEQRRALAGMFMARFICDALPRLASLRSQVIHNDYHLYNVLVAPDDQARIVGIIDFGDMLHAPLVGEVATAAAFRPPSTWPGTLIHSRAPPSSWPPNTRPCRSPMSNKRSSPI